MTLSGNAQSWTIVLTDNQPSPVLFKIMQLYNLATIVKMFGFLLKQNKATILSKKKKNHNRVVRFLFGFSYYKAM